MQTSGLPKSTDVDTPQSLAGELEEREKTELFMFNPNEELVVDPPGSPLQEVLCDETGEAASTDNESELEFNDDPDIRNLRSALQLCSLGTLRKQQLTSTVLCKSNANEMREFHFLFPRLFVESTRENSSRNSRRLERQFAKTKADISTNFRDLNDNSPSIALIRKSIYEISLRTKWLFVSLQQAIDTTMWLCNLHEK